MVNESGEILELFSPQLNTEKTARFNSLVQRIACAFPNYRIQLVQNELNSFEADDNDIEGVKYTAALNILIDLWPAGLAIRGAR